jgi:hypothetical protein
MLSITARRAIHRSTWALIGLGLLGPIGCQIPIVTRDYDEFSDVTKVRAGPISMGWLGIRSLVVSASVSGAVDKAPTPPRYVEWKFANKGFDRVHVVADGQRFTFTKPLFQEYTVRVKAEDFVRIASSQRVLGKFDDEEDHFQLSAEELDLLRQFAAEVGLVGPGADAPRSV